MNQRKVIFRTALVLFILVASFTIGCHLAQANPVKKKQQEVESFEAIVILVCETDQNDPSRWICIIKPTPLTDDEDEINPKIKL